MQRKSPLAVHPLHTSHLTLCLIGSLVISTQQTDFEVAEYSASVGHPAGQPIRIRELPLQKQILDVQVCVDSVQSWLSSVCMAVHTVSWLHKLHYAACTAGKYMLLSTWDLSAPAA